MIVLLLKVTLLWTLVLAMQPLLRRCSAATRHVIYSCALAGALLLPVSLLAPPEIGAFRIDASGVLSASRATLHGGAHWPVADVILSLWAMGTLVLLLRLGIGHRTLAQLLRNAVPFEATGTTPVFFADVSVPVVAGLLRPVILLPRAARCWTDSQVSAALKHERQHVERKDLWTMSIGHLACAIYWFHPLAWAVARRARQEQESACDDAVLASGFEPACYAEALVAAACHITSTRLIGCPMLTRQTLKSRIARLFDSGLARIPSRAGLCGATMASIAAIGLVGMLIGTQQAVGQGNPGGKDRNGDQVYKVGNGVTPPKVLSKVDPEYTPEASAEKISGTVLLTVVIGTDGIAHDINVVSGIGSGLNEKAVEAVQQWHFQPGMKDGEPVQVRAQIEVNFRFK
jgi:TonB family protein